MVNDSNFTNLNQRLEEIYKEADNKLTYVHYISTGLLFILGLIFQQFFLALSGIIIISLLFFIFKYFIKNRGAKNWLLSVSLILWPIFFTAISGGMVEIRFIFFAYLFLIVIYHDSSPIFLLSGLAAMVVVLYSVSIIHDTNWANFMATYLLEPSNATYERMFVTLFVLFVSSSAAIFLNNLFRKRTINRVKNEIEQEKQLKIFNKNKVIADEIAGGNLEKKDIEQKAGEEINDELGYSLDNMRKSLKEASEKDKKDKFINVGLAEIAEILRKHNQDIDDLTDQVLRHLVKYLDVNQGGLFVLEKEEQQEPYLELKASYAFNKKKYTERTLKVGQGLAGQVVREKDKMYLREIPQDYVYITSGLGKATPNTLLIVPLMVNEEVEGVIELASFKELADYEIEFVEKVAQSIASSISSVKVNTRTKRLLEESQQQAEEMKAQEEEMRQNTEELQATQEEMQRKEAELDKKLKEALKELEEKNIQQNLDEIALEIEDSIKYASHELRFLSKIPAISAIFNARSNNNIDPASGEPLETWIDRFGSVVNNLLENKKIYHKILLSDINGEILYGKKFEKNNLKEIEEESGILKNSSFFKNTIREKENKVYAGSIQFLNKKGHATVIELGIPLYFKEKIRGCILLELFTNEFIEDIKTRENDSGHFHLITSSGKRIYGNAGIYQQGKKIEKVLKLDTNNEEKLIICHTSEEEKETEEV